MRLLIAAFAVLWLCVAPMTVNAQPVTPVPVNPPSSAAVADTLMEAADRFGTTAVLEVIALLIVGAVVWFVLRPSMGNTASAQQNVAAAQRDLASTNRELLTYLRGNDKVIERNSDAFEGVKAAYDKSTDAYGKLDKTVHDTWTNLEAQLKRDREAGEKADMATQKQIRDVNERLDAVVELLRRIQEEIIPGGGYRKALDRAIEMVEQTKLNDTGELPPLSSVTDQDPGKAPSIWEQDNPPATT